MTDFPNAVQFCGFIEEQRELPASERSGARYEAQLRNPTEGKHSDDVVCRMLGFGKKGRKLLDLPMGTLVSITGRFGPSPEVSSYVVVEKIHVMDEEGQ